MPAAYFRALPAALEHLCWHCAPPMTGNQIDVGDVVANEHDQAGRAPHRLLGARRVVDVRVGRALDETTMVVGDSDWVDAQP